jgi:hypothetical protein
VKRKHSFLGYSTIMHKSLFLIALLFVCYSLAAAPPSYGSGKPTADKIRYCQAMVRKFSHLSQRINDDYYGIGVSKPNRNDWTLRTKEPGWFSSDLYIIFEQTTKEKYDDFTHTIACHWDEDSFFTVTVLDHHYGSQIVCDWSAFIADEYECP